MKDIEPIHSLAFSMQAQPKLYALLLGSGISRAANVPTGWDVVLDLIGKLAAMVGEEPKDPYQWYWTHHGAEPDYSELLERIAPAPADRQQLQRQYWEGNSADARAPTKAHRAIADLAKEGFIKVIVTTNFDRLMENALREVGVEPMILRSPDDIAGMTPLEHTECCVLKLHGDYMDERVRNTKAELSQYPKVVNDLLDRIFDEYGLLICGWSGDWDIALSEAIRRTPSRRYTTYWAAYGDLGDTAKHIVDTKGAKVIAIESADRFFGDLFSLVQSLKGHSNPHPLSVQATVAQCKRFLAHDHHRIDLADLIDSIGREALSDLADLSQPEIRDSDSLVDRMRRYEDVCSKLLSTAVTASYWSDAAQIDAWSNTMELFFQEVKDIGAGIGMALSSYPAILLTYALAIGAVAHRRLDTLGRILAFPTGREVERHGEHTTLRTEGEVAYDMANAMPKFIQAEQAIRQLADMKDRRLPTHDWLFETLRPHTVTIIPSEKRFERVFDRTETLLSLACGVRTNESQGRYLFTSGCFVYRGDTYHDTVAEINKSLEREGDESPFVRHGLVGHSAEDAEINLEAFFGHVMYWANSLNVIIRP